MKNDEIVSVVSNIFGITAIQLGSKDRSENVTTAKIAYCGLVRDIQKFTTINLMLGISTPSAKKFIKKCDELLQTDENFSSLYYKAQEKLAKMEII